MRKILFRGKRTDNGEWVYGYYEFYNGGHYINVQTDRVNSGGYPIREFIEVIPETVGQYTGLIDKNGTKIFEGDILEYVDSDNEVGYLTVVFEECAFLIEEDGITNPDLLTSYVALGLKVVGNIHDSPELLKGGDSEE